MVSILKLSFEFIDKSQGCFFFGHRVASVIVIEKLQFHIFVLSILIARIKFKELCSYAPLYCHPCWCYYVDKDENQMDVEIRKGSKMGDEVVKHSCLNNNGKEKQF